MASLPPIGSSSVFPNAAGRTCAGPRAAILEEDGRNGPTLKKASLLHRFSLLSFGAFLLFGLILGAVVTSSLEADFIARSKQMTARFIAEEVKREFQGIDFTRPMAGPLYEEFRKRVPHLLFTSDIRRVKVWNPDKVVVWADDRQLVGKRFPDNPELLVALGGEVSSEIKVPRKAENRYERGTSRLLELYVPVRLEPGADVGAVIEVYQDLEHLYADVARRKFAVWGAIFLGFAAVYLACFGIVWQASRRIEAQTREIRQSEEKYQGLVRSAPSGVIGIDGDGRIVLFNEAAEAMFGYGSEEVVGRPLTMLMPESFRVEHQAGLRKAVETGEPAGRFKVKECEGLRRDGRVFPIELSISVSGEPGNVLVTGILRDITERKAMQDQLIDAEKQALVSVIAGSIGHEINNSITGVAGFAELLESTPDDPGLARKCAEAFTIQSQRLRLHAKNLLSLSKPRAPEMGTIDIVALLDRVTEMLTVSGPLKKYLVRKEYGESLPMVRGDALLLEQVVMNLEINASHAMGDHGVLTLAVRPSEDGSSVAFSVTDTGRGIQEDSRHLIFLPFYTTKEKGKGTGLGLFIAKRIVEQHDGSIETHSVVGKGTTFTIRLPAVRPS